MSKEGMKPYVLETALDSPSAMTVEYSNGTCQHFCGSDRPTHIFITYKRDVYTGDVTVCSEKEPWILSH